MNKIDRNNLKERRIKKLEENAREKMKAQYLFSAKRKIYMMSLILLKTIDKNFTPKDLALILDIKQPRVSDLLRSHKDKFSEDTLSVYSFALGCSRDEIYNSHLPIDKVIGKINDRICSNSNLVKFEAYLDRVVEEYQCTIQE